MHLCILQNCISVCNSGFVRVMETINLICTDLWSQLTDEEKRQVYSGIGYDEAAEGSSVDSIYPIQVNA